MDLKSIEQKLDIISSRAEIQDKIVLYGLGQDLHVGDDNNVLEQWSQMFAEDTVIDMGGTEFGLGQLSFRDYAAWMRGAKPGDKGMFAAWRTWQHIQGHAAITFDGDAKATSVTPYFHTHASHDDSFNTLSAGYWHDRWERRGGEWKIVYRRVELRYFQTVAAIDLPVSLNGAD